MDITSFLSIAVVGALLSGVIQFIKTKFAADASGLIVKMATVVLSIIIGGLYVWLQSSPLYETILGVLGSASTVYALFLR